jgi:hypothetical protein
LWGKTVKITQKNDTDQQQTKLSQFGEALGLAKIICPNTGEYHGQEVIVHGLECREGEGIRVFWDSIEL